MFRTILSSKIHRCYVTSADLHYIGSITIDPVLMEAANIVPFEKVQVVNLTNGNRWETYAITGNPGDGKIQVNGGGARLVAIGDILIIMTYAMMADPIAPEFQPRVVMVDEKNRITEVFGMDPKGRASISSDEVWPTPADNLSVEKHPAEKHPAVVGARKLTS